MSWIARSTSNAVLRNSTSSPTTAQNAATSPSYGIPTEPAFAIRPRRNCMCVWPATTSRWSTPARAASKHSSGESCVRICSSLPRRRMAVENAVELDASSATRRPRDGLRRRASRASARRGRARSCRGRNARRRARARARASRAGTALEDVAAEDDCVDGSRATSASTASSAWTIPWTSYRAATRMRASRRSRGRRACAAVLPPRARADAAIARSFPACPITWPTSSFATCSRSTTTSSRSSRSTRTASGSSTSRRASVSRSSVSQCSGS